MSDIEENPVVQPPEDDPELVEKLAASVAFMDTSEGIDVCFSFDTTGSMYACLDNVRKNIESTVTELLTAIPKMRISIISHGDYCDGENSITMFDFSSDIKAICNFVRNVASTGGGDYPENYELVLRECRKLSWKPNHSKALVMIGDAPPHPPSYTDKYIYWKDEIHFLFRRLGVKIYGVQAYASPSVKPFYQEISRKTGGVYLTLSNFSYITSMFKGICYREDSIESLKNFRKTLGATDDKSLQELLNKLEIENTPDALGQYDMDWWDISRDPGLLNYVSTPVISKPIKGKKFENYLNWKYASCTKVDMKHLRSLFVVDREPDVESDDENEETATTRTGTSILDKKAKLTIKQVVEKAPVGPIGVRYIMKRNADDIMELVLASPEEVAAEEERVRLIELKKEQEEMEAKAKADNVKLIEESDKLLKDAEYVKTAEVVGQNASLRLMKDLKEVENNPVYNVAAVPLDSDLFEWHCNISGPPGTVYEGIIFHLILKFPTNYPCSPPNVKICSKMYHPNVYGSWVCLDMLELGVMGTARKTSKLNCGWTTAYSALSILVQLQAFLFEKIYVDEHVVAETRKYANAFKCTCGHSSKKEETVTPKFKLTSLPEKEKVKPAAAAAPAAPVVPAVTRRVEKEESEDGTVVPVKPVAVDVTLKSTNTPSEFYAQHKLLLKQLKKGTERIGRVDSVKDFGAFVDIGVIDVVCKGDNDNWVSSLLPITALLHKSKIKKRLPVWNAVDYVKKGTYLKVYVSDIDHAKKRISISAYKEDDVEEEEVVESAVSSLGLRLGANNTRPALVIKKPSKSRSALDQSLFAEVPLEVMNIIFSNLNPVVLHTLGKTCHYFHKVTADGISYLWEQKEIVCFHSKRHFTDEVLGVGLNLEIKLNGSLAYITTTFDLLSLTSFIQEKVRKASYKEPFSHWLPLYINQQHGKRALPVIKDCLTTICKEIHGPVFKPEMVLTVIPKLMNSMVVSLMSGRLYTSIMALEGYCAFHHLFLVLVEEFPELKAKIDDTIKQFLTSERLRHKNNIPALGEWLPLLTVTSTYSWKDVSEAYLVEMFDRNVLWTLKKYPEMMHQFGPKYYDMRLSKVFKATEVSNRLLMFHVYFLKHIARPDGVSLDQLKKILDFRCGRPTYSMKEQLLQECKSILKVNTWDKFFERIHVSNPSNETLGAWLEKCYENSLRRHYHDPKRIEYEIKANELQAKIDAEGEDKKKKKKKRAELSFDDYEVGGKTFSY
eukprot:TRINITY_DN8834_c0_g1_i1.p1 TRINITY_DN8834_c0_g1~~TRINITY_DN8834_c0_g1_i1.p1  ORF type:complete len:1235 (-),score=323.08 TRINITY_DN8834_c0_g1_i1:121-3825(-)